MTRPTLRIGYAGWQIPRQYADRFDGGDSHLQRYATRFSCSEINSSFYKTHRPSTYESWAAAVPDGFLFAVKAPKQITHASRLADLSALGYFLADVAPLGEKMGPLLLQLPPGFAFDAERVKAFLIALRFRYRGLVACEPRHTSWFTGEADQLLAEHEVARVAADPAPVPAAAQPGGWQGLAYYRLHGAPHMYYSGYSSGYLDTLARTLAAHGSTPTWCIFDNTAEGEATDDALGVIERMSKV
jgi:uncharacterized protein YecE (DUF72 family)